MTEENKMEEWKQQYRSLLLKTGETYSNLTPERHQELNDIWKSFLSNAKEIDITKWKITGQPK